LDDDVLRRRLGLAGRRAVEKFYNWDRVVRDLEDIETELRLARSPIPG
jgi:glycosyltransferase involved in cell wall biosynthesis